MKIQCTWMWKWSKQQLESSFIHKTIIQILYILYLFELLYLELYKRNKQRKNNNYIYEKVYYD